MDTASHLRQRILPVLQGWAGRLRAEFPEFTAHAQDMGSRGLALDCILLDTAPGQPDRVALQIALRNADGKVAIQSAEIVWGHPSGRIEAGLQAPGGELTPEHIEEVAERLPELFAALRRAIRRGHPQA